MRGILLTAILVTFFGVNGARADTPPQQSESTALAPDTDQPPAAGTALVPLQVNRCANYPALAVRLNHEGATVLNLAIDDAGKVTKTDVAQSSGFPELDQAAVECVTSAWRFAPATQNGKPVASTKQYRVVWKLMNPNTPPWLKTDPDGLCNPVFGKAKIRWPSYRTVTLQFRVSATGAVIYPFAAVSSGDPLFDAKAMECMTKLSYTPARLSGLPSEVSWTAIVRWSARTGLAFTDGGDMGPYCADSDFPASIWKGDPPNPTDISFQIALGAFAANFAIEQPSGNPELDQAALACLQSRVRPLPEGWRGPMPAAHLVRFNWRQGHAFTLNLH